MNEQRRKEAYRLFWIIKRHLKPFSDKDLENLYNSYFYRAWYNEESYLYEEGFEEAYEEFTRGRNRIDR